MVAFACTCGDVCLCVRMQGPATVMLRASTVNNVRVPLGQGSGTTMAKVVHRGSCYVGLRQVHTHLAPRPTPWSSYLAAMRRVPGSNLKHLGARERAMMVRAGAIKKQAGKAAVVSLHTASKGLESLGTDKRVILALEEAMREGTVPMGPAEAPLPPEREVSAGEFPLSLPACTIHEDDLQGR